MGSEIALFPCVGCLGNGTGGNHVQQVLSLTLHSGGGLMARQAGVHVGHGHTCQATNTSGQWIGDQTWNTFSNLSPPPPPEINLPQDSDYAPNIHDLVSRLSTCIATALLPPGGHVALVTAAAPADLCPLMQRACCSVLTWPAAQRCCRHCTLQLGGGERVGHATRAHCRLEAV